MAVNHNKIHLYPFLMVALCQMCSVFVGDLNADTQTEFLYPKINPYQLRGRWFQAFIVYQSYLSLRSLFNTELKVNLFLEP